jgi:hypothetical protein
MDLSEVGEENLPRILKNRWMRDLVAEKSPMGHRRWLGEEIDRRDQRGVGAPFNTPEPDLSDISDLGSDISDRPDISGPNRICLTIYDLAKFSSKIDLSQIYPSWDGYIRWFQEQTWRIIS